MTLEGVLIGLGSLGLTGLGFVFGKIFSQSENILDRKREAYREFLLVCPSPNEAHFDTDISSVEMQRQVGILTLYGSGKALKYAGAYFSAFAYAQKHLVDVEEPGHPEFLKVMTSYNRMVWEMRTDAMTWSIFAPTRENRIYKPSIDLEKNK